MMKELLRKPFGRWGRFAAVRYFTDGRTDTSMLRLAGVKDVIAVASGKGGVGKSTTAVNLAVALADKCHLKVGLLDADVYGPSIPMMMKIDRKPDITQDKKMIPIESYGVKCMSMGILVDKDAALVWRGLMVINALKKMIWGVDWGNLDILVVDMPPGTGDTQITITQQLQLSGAVIVSTPQDAALIDARRGITMFTKVEVPILGLVENMSYFRCPNCSNPYYIFGREGTRKLSDSLGYSLLAEIPIEVDVRKGSDDGLPIVVSAPDSDASKAYCHLAEIVVKKLQLTNRFAFLPDINL